MDENAAVCPRCKRNFTRKRIGRTAKYCSDKCRGGDFRSRGKPTKGFRYDQVVTATLEEVICLAGEASTSARRIEHDNEPGMQALLLEQVNALVQEAGNLATLVVHQMRDRGVTWKSIGERFRVSANTASKRWTPEELRRVLVRRGIRTPRSPQQRSSARQFSSAMQSGAGLRWQPWSATAGRIGTWRRGALRSPSRIQRIAPVTARPVRVWPPAADPSTRLIEELNRQRVLAGKSPADLEAETKIDITHIRRVLTGKKMPSLPMAHRIYAACHGKPNRITPLWHAARGRPPQLPSRIILPWNYTGMPPGGSLPGAPHDAGAKGFEPTRHDFAVWDESSADPWDAEADQGSSSSPDTSGPLVPDDHPCLEEPLIARTPDNPQ
jgi:hypothetical protein